MSAAGGGACSRGGTCSWGVPVPRGVPPPRGPAPKGVCGGDSPSQQTATVADSTHPTGMHSC